MNWNKKADLLQKSLHKEFWDEDKQMYMQHAPQIEDKLFRYWWYAHVADALLDAYLRTEDGKYLTRARLTLKGARKKNGHTYINNWYDDMEWIALALLRIYDISPDEKLKTEIYTIWHDIWTAWNDKQDGGLAWKKDQIDYKNTPANAPAAILGYRLYQRFNNETDLEWADRIYRWNKDYLLDKNTDFVWDGINRLGDGKIDYDWEYSYCQGVFVGASLERYLIYKDEIDLNQAFRTTKEAFRRLTDSKTSMLRSEGPDDCGLFRGIMIRYFTLFALQFDETDFIKSEILHNANLLFDNARNSRNLVGEHWFKPTEGVVDLAQHLSAVMLMEAAAALD